MLFRGVVLCRIRIKCFVSAGGYFRSQAYHDNNPLTINVRYRYRTKTTSRGILTCGLSRTCRNSSFYQEAKRRKRNVSLGKLYMHGTNPAHVPLIELPPVPDKLKDRKAEFGFVIDDDFQCNYYKNMPQVEDDKIIATDI